MRKILFKMKKSKIIYSFIAVVLIAGSLGICVKAQPGERSANIKSKGVFEFDNGSAVIDTSDLTYLADEIDLLEDTYKTGAVKALNGINTYFNPDGSITHVSDENTLLPEVAAVLPYHAILSGITNSQSVPQEHNGAASGNLSRGTAAWVNGSLVVGNGADNDSFYNRGFSEGNDQGYDKGLKDGNKQGYDKGLADGNKQGYNTGFNEGKNQGYNEGYERGVEDGASQMTIKTGSYTWTFGGNKWATDGSYLDISGSNSSLSYNTGKSHLIACAISETNNLNFYSYDDTNKNHFAPGQLTTSIDSSGNIYINVPAGMRITNYYGTGENDYGTTTITVTYYYY